MTSADNRQAVHTSLDLSAPNKLPLFTPAFECIAKLKEVSAIDSLVFGAVWRYAQQSEDKRLCNTSPVKIADRIGATHNVARRSLKNLCQARLLEDLTPETNGKTHTYFITDKAHDLLLVNLTRNGQGDSQDNEPTLPISGKLTLPETGKHLTRNGQATLPETGNKDREREIKKEERETHSPGLKNSDFALSVFTHYHGKLTKATEKSITKLVEAEAEQFNRKHWETMCDKIASKPGLTGRIDLVIQDYRAEKPKPAVSLNDAQLAAYQQLQAESQRRDALLSESLQQRLDPAGLTAVGVEVEVKKK